MNESLRDKAIQIARERHHYPFGNTVDVEKIEGTIDLILSLLHTELRGVMEARRISEQRKKILIKKGYHEEINGLLAYNECVDDCLSALDAVLGGGK